MSKEREGGNYTARRLALFVPFKSDQKGEVGGDFLQFLIDTGTENGDTQASRKMKKKEIHADTGTVPRCRWTLPADSSLLQQLGDLCVVELYLDTKVGPPQSHELGSKILNDRISS